jgi:hypothetical protein
LRPFVGGNLRGDGDRDRDWLATTPLAEAFPALNEDWGDKSRPSAEAAMFRVLASSSRPHPKTDTFRVQQRRKTSLPAADEPRPSSSRSNTQYQYRHQNLVGQGADNARSHILDTRASVPWSGTHAHYRHARAAASRDWPVQIKPVLGEQALLRQNSHAEGKSY